MRAQTTQVETGWTIFTWPVVRMSRNGSGQGRWAWLRWPTKGRYLWRLWMVPNDLKHIQASLLLTSTDCLSLRAAQVPRCRDLVIFVVMTTDRQTNRLQTDRQTNKPITLPLRMRAGQLCPSCTITQMQGTRGVCALRALVYSEFHILPSSFHIHRR